MTEHSEIAEWRRLVDSYEEVIVKFEQVRSDLHKRRSSATDTVMRIIDERLELNERTLIVMREGMETAKRGMRRAEQGQRRFPSA